MNLREYVVNYLVELEMHEPEAEMLFNDFVKDSNMSFLEDKWVIEFLTMPEATMDLVKTYLNKFAADWVIKFQPTAPYRKALEDAAGIERNT